MRVYCAKHIKEKFHEGRGNVNQDDRGKQCFVHRGPLVFDVAEDFGRSGLNLCLKVFFDPLEPGQDIDDYYWGKSWRKYSLKRTEEIGRISRLVQATTIQNWLWMDGLAPRVYGIVLIERKGKRYPAQLTEYIEGENEETLHDMGGKLDLIEEKINVFGCMPVHRELVGKHDFIDGKIIDLQGYRWTGKTKEKVRNFVETTGRYGKAHYQDVDKMGITGKPRNTTERIRSMGLNTIDFNEKDVLDVGCNSGAFCMYATDRGAKYVMGLDLPHHVKAAQTLAFFLGYHNIDYFNEDLLHFDGVSEEYDITLFLSMNMHVDFPKWIPLATKELLVFEENAKQSKFRPDYWEQELSKWFTDVKIVGYTNDQNPKFKKPVFHCKKGRK